MTTLIGLLILAHLALACFLAVKILHTRAEPFAMAFWLLACFTVPLIGPALYLLLDEIRLSARASRKMSAEEDAAPETTEEARCPLHDLPPDMRRVAWTASTLEDAPLTRGNQVELMDDTEQVHRALLQIIESARDSLHLEYYIWQPDETGREVLDAIIACARRGVTCRLLLDAAGSWNVPRKFLAPANEAGVDIAFFMPFRPTSRRIGLHLRNHRKIVVVDGKRALTGSQNVADLSRGHAGDSAMRQVHLDITGPAVTGLQEIFLHDWFVATREHIDPAQVCPPHEINGDSTLQVVATGPDRPQHTLERILMEALAMAEDHLWIATPYFVPTESVRLALAQAAVRGVAIDIVIPSQYERRIMHWAARSYYPALIDAGVRIHEYEPGMVHAKLLAVDQRWAMVGTANMDTRSFRLNFEVSILAYDQDLARHVTDRCKRYQAESRTIMQEDIQDWNTRARLQAGIGRMLSPQL